MKTKSEMLGVVINEVVPNHGSMDEIIAESPSACSIKELAKQLHLKVPRKLVSHLAKRGIHTLEDIREAGGISTRDLPIDPNHPAVEQLQAHANLSMLSDPATNSILINKGYTTISKITKVRRKDFIEALRKELGEPEAARLHAEAQAYNLIIGEISLFDHGKFGGFIDEIDITEICLPKIRDCGSAIGLLAYLADLLDYTIKNITKYTYKLTLQELVGRFLQPFDAILKAYETSNREVRQIRICVEILRQYLKKNPPTDSAVVSVLESKEKEYLLATYTLLLDKIGTSYEELRFARKAEVKKRKALANRLGIDFDPSGQDQLGAFFLEPDLHPPNPKAITEKKLEELFGLAETSVDRNPLVEGGVPFLLKLRLEHLRTVWKEQDWPTDPYGEGSLPIIDPDLIGPDDLRRPATGQPVFDLWIRRRTWVDDRLDQFKLMTKTVNNETIPDLQAMITTMKTGIQYGASAIPLWPSTANMDEMLDDLVTGIKPDIGEKISSDLFLSVESFTRFMKIKAKHESWESDKRNEQVSSGEWEDVYSILVQAQKRASYKTWLVEEKSAGLSFSMTNFWISLREPFEGEWPIRRAQGVPWIDPDLLKAADLPDSLVGANARTFLTARKDELDKLCDSMELERSSGFEKMLVKAFGTPPAGSTWVGQLDGIAADLLNTNQAGAARTRIENELKMTEGEFNFLMTIKAKDQTGTGQSKKPPTTEEWAHVYRLLTRVHKEIFLYSTWAQQEGDASKGVKYDWQAHKARLPMWRSSREGRNAWQQALRSSEKEPLIDPDLIGKDDIENPASGDPAFDLWQKRRKNIDSVWSNFKKKREAARTGSNGSSMVELGAVLAESSLKLVPNDILILANDYYQGNNIAARLNQLILSEDAFSRLLSIHNLAVDDQPILSLEWDEIYSILTQIEKRLSFAGWRKEEKLSGLSLSPDHFETPTVDRTSFSARQPLELPAWRATSDQRHDWQNILRSRIGQEVELTEELKTIVSATEEATMPMLRDALIMAAKNVPGVTLDAKAEWLSDHLLVDFNASSFSKSTRLSNAIWTIQKLIWSVRTGQLSYANSGFELHAPNFSEEWKWLGSYVDWCAAMGIFLFPDNMLYPRLRDKRSSAFKEFAKKYDSINSETADMAAAEYSNYLRDITHLALEAGTYHEKVFYCFARSLTSNRVYWSSRRLSSHEQSFWEEIPCLGSDIAELEGAVSFELNQEEYIYLFAKETKNKQEQLLFARYNPRTREWSKQATLLDVKGEQNWFARVRRTKIYEPPSLVLFFQGSSPVTRYLNSNGTAWSGNDFQPAGDDKSRLVALGSWTHLSPILDHEVCPDVDFKLPNSQIVSALAGDFDGDGKDEIAGVTSDRLRIMDYDTKSSDPASWEWVNLHTESIPSAGFVPKLTVAGDFDGDGRDEIAYYTSKKFQIIDFNPVTGKWGSLCALNKSADYIWVGDFDGNGRDEVAVYVSNSYTVEFMGYDPSTKSWVSLGVSPNFKADLTIGEFAVVGDFDGDKREGIFFGQRHMYSNYANTKLSIISFNPLTKEVEIRESTDNYQEVWAPCKFGVAGDFDGDGRDEVAVAVLGSTGNKNNFHVVDGSFIQKAIFAAHAGCDYPHKYGIAGDFDGDGRDEIAVALDAPGSVGNDFWVMDYDPLANAWRQLSRIERFSEGTSFDCSSTDYPAMLALSGNFDGDVLKSVAVLPNMSGKPNDALWVIKLSIVPLVFSEPFGLADKPSEWNSYRRWTLTKEALKGVGKGNTQYIEEAYYHLPIHLALALQKRGEYLAALDWFRMVYGYDMPSSPDDRRNVYYGLEMSNEPMDYARRNDWLLHVNPHVFAERRPNAYLRFTLFSLVRCLLDYADAEFTKDSQESLVWAQALYVTALELLDMPVIKEYEKAVGTLEISVDDALICCFYIPRNLILKALRFRAQLNLFKLRSGRNIAGVKRQLEPYTAPTDAEMLAQISGTGGQVISPGAMVFRPTPYRYRTLIERAKELAQIAGQIEAAMLNTYEKFDMTSYDILKANNDVRLTNAQVQLQNLRYNEADSATTLATMQSERSKLQYDFYDELLKKNLSQLETEYLQLLNDVVEAQEWVKTIYEDLDVPAITGFGVSGGASIGASVSFRSVEEIVRQEFLDMASEYSAKAGVAGAKAAIKSTMAGYERRKRDWEFQKNLADKDTKIGQQQEKIAKEHLLVVGQERFISEVQAEQAVAVVQFLHNKFTSDELYSWMSGVLENVYRFFLQQATAMAQLSLDQLGFERHEALPPLIQADYWEAPSDKVTGDQTSENDRRGLTGSARLLEDIHRLDQYAFESEKRKLQIAKTISLAQHFSYELQNFRETGVMNFATPMSLFDRDFPGHYMRLIKRVRVSVIALIPPNQGIKAMLTSSGISRVVVGGDIFQMVVVRHNPESVALSSPLNATGVFELEPQSEMLLPFEATGVDTAWEFTMPKGSNFFDYGSIADVLLTIEYTALDSYDYRQQVIGELGRDIIVDRPFSFRHHFADQWYDLHNPQQKAEPMKVRFETTKDDFPPNIGKMKIHDAVFCFIWNEKRLVTDHTIDIALTDGSGTLRINTILDNGRIARGGFRISGKSPEATWELALPDTEDVRNLFKNEEIEDILFVITYSGEVPEWPDF